MTIDTACSSSLVGAHYAVNELGKGTCSMAVTAGANITATPERSASFAVTGNCDTFYKLRYFVNQ